MPQVLFEIVYRAPMKPSELAHGVPDDVDRVIAIALAKKADDRFQTAGELAAAMAAAAKGALAPALRQRADRLIAAIPWGRRAQPVAVAS
jgi:serine/threonine-protein kinase